MISASVDRSPDTFFALLDAEIELRRITAITDWLGLLRKCEGDKKCNDGLDCKAYMV